MRSRRAAAYLSPHAGRGRIVPAMRSIVRCDPGEGRLRESEIVERPPHPVPLPARGEREIDPSPFCPNPN